MSNATKRPEVNDRRQLLAAGVAFGPYQAARTRILAGGAEGSCGASALTDLGITPAVTATRADTSA